LHKCDKKENILKADNIHPDPAYISQSEKVLSTFV